MNHVKAVVFPKMIEMADEKSSFWEYMQGAECKIRKAGLLIEVCNLIDQMKIAEQNQDVQGDLYEYMLGHMQFAGRGGQFRTPWHIIRIMVQMVDPKPRERIGSMNLMLHGIESPQFYYMDSLSRSFDDEREYDVILMNPPFKGAVDKGEHTVKILM